MSEELLRKAFELESQARQQGTNVIYFDPSHQYGDYAFFEHRECASVAIKLLWEQVLSFVPQEFTT